MGYNGDVWSSRARWYAHRGVTVGWFRKILEAVETEYDRRIRRASEVIAYGMKHGEHHDHAHPPQQEHTAEGEKEAVVTNVPVGTRIPLHAGEEHQ